MSSHGSHGRNSERYRQANRPEETDRQLRNAGMERGARRHYRQVTGLSARTAPISPTAYQQEFLLRHLGLGLLQDLVQAHEAPAVL